MRRGRAGRLFRFGPIVAAAASPFLSDYSAASVDDLNLLATELRSAIGRFELGEADAAATMPAQEF
ncbi:hypothetical protein [Cohnella sp. OV330]|uniref:hypothetical protein n=1 Tax=Cohnella sp. OV330 TaxID=1855288 RepID=UPI000B8023C2|nr:hypothetical protein [Cohnella sp. OV330]